MPLLHRVFKPRADSLYLIVRFRKAFQGEICKDCAKWHNSNQLSRRYSAISVLETELTCDATTVSITTAGSTRSYHLVQWAKFGNLASSAMQDLETNQSDNDWQPKLVSFIFKAASQCCKLWLLRDVSIFAATHWWMALPPEGGALADHLHCLCLQSGKAWLLALPEEETKVFLNLIHKEESFFVSLAC